jgi:hypothetical protein
MVAQGPAGRLGGGLDYDVGMRMRMVWTGALLTLLVGCGGGGPSPAPLTPGLLLPDGRTRGSIDFLIDAAALEASALVVDRGFSATDCAVVEGIIEGEGLHRLLVFDTRIVNMGEFDLHIGDPANPLAPFDPAMFEYHDCHGHRHMHGYASYELRTLDGGIAATGHKQGFCLLDSQRWLTGAADRRYTCVDQGLTSGWADLYARTVDGQWVDVTGLPQGDYLLVVTINAEGLLPEAVDHHPNTAAIVVRLPDPAAPVETPDDHGDTAPEATPVPLPSGMVAVIETIGDADWFQVDVTAGTAYVFHTELLSLPDSRLRLTTANGVSNIAENDDVDPGSDPSSRIEWTATFTGPVALEVTGVGTARGGYRIVVE